MKLLNLSIAISTLCAVLTASVGNASVLQCPEVDQLAATPAEAAVLSRIPKGLSLEQSDQLQDAIVLLRGRGMSAADIINHLIALVCPAITEDPGLPEQEKTAQIWQFSRVATKAVLQERVTEFVIFNVPLRPSVAEAAAARARKAGIKTEHWLAKTIEEAIP